jgi:FkbH-like protein
MKFVRAARGKARKCLVLDCDNTLWGGIVGEDGMASLQISPDYPGSIYREFQLYVLSLHDRGVILALCSKNNEADVWDVFRKRPEMILQEQHISAAQINWNDKVSNLRRIAEDLNIGLDSLVLVDDSEFEIQMVRELLPEVATILVPPKNASEARDILARCGYFDSLVVSAEDRKRGQMYRVETQRRRLRSASVDLSSYLASLEISVRIEPVGELSLPRAFQLTQRTNQFNLTSHRYSMGDLSAFHKSTDHDVMILRVTDRFGDYGVVGVAILRHKQATTEIDSFLMSCRVMGRGVEQAFLAACLDIAHRRASHVVYGRYIKSAKNGLAEEFLDNSGFELTSEHDGERRYARDMIQPIPKLPSHLRTVDVQFPETFA